MTMPEQFKQKNDMTIITLANQGDEAQKMVVISIIFNKLRYVQELFDVHLDRLQSHDPHPVRYRKTSG